MDMRLRFTLLVLAAMPAAAGCQQADRLISAPPSRAELPAFAEVEPTLSIVVGVEGAGTAPRIVLVPQYEEIPLTPEEREALGEKEQPEPDALLLYRPPRGPEHGVSAELFETLVGIGGIGGALVGHGSVYPRFGTYGFAGRHSYAHVLPRLGASVGRPRSRAGAVGRPWVPEVGEGLPRKRARAASRVYR